MGKTNNWDTHREQAELTLPPLWADAETNNYSAGWRQGDLMWNCEIQWWQQEEVEAFMICTLFLNSMQAADSISMQFNSS